MRSPRRIIAVTGAILILAMTLIVSAAPAPPCTALPTGDITVDYSSGSGSCTDSTISLISGATCNAAGCAASYTLSGTQLTYTCIAGTWTGGPTCLPPGAACNTVPAAEVGSAVDLTAAGTTCQNAATSPFASGSRCTYGCKAGFQPSGLATCINGVWSTVFCMGFDLPSQMYAFGTRV